MTAAKTMLLAMLSFPLEVQAQAPRRIRVAILDVRAVGTEIRQAAMLSEVARDEASRIAGLEVIAGGSIAAVLGAEGRQQALDCIEEAGCLKEVGGRLRVDHLLVASLSQLGTRRRVDMRLADARSARTEAETFEAIEGRDDRLAAAARRLVHRLLDPLAVAAPGGAVPAGTTRLVAPPVVLPTSPAEPATAESATSVVSRAPQPSISRRAWGLACAGAGLGMIAGGAAFGVMASSAYQAEKRASQAGDLAAYESSKSAAKSRALAADVLFAAGAVGLGVGTWLHLSGREGGGISLAASPVRGGAVATVGGEF